MDFAAIDFETATSQRNSACSVAIVQVRNGEICDSYYTLLRPPDMRFYPFNISIHGIHPEDVADAPTFAEAWPEMRKKLEGRIVVAHNASFDMGVLRASLAGCHLPKPCFSYCCTVKISQRAWPDLANHKLDTMGEFLHARFRHHDALEDAKICAMIPLAAGNEIHADDFREMAARFNVPVRSF